MLIQTERLVLRPWCDADAKSLYRYAKDPDVGPAAGWPPHRSEEESLRVIRTALCGSECYAVCLKQDLCAVGAAELILKQGQAGSEHECELGFWIGRPFWGRGYITEAARALLARAFADLGMTAVRCGYYAGNVRSKRVQEKLGFRPDRIRPDADVPLLGEKRVCCENLLTREDWLSGAGETRHP